MTVRRHLQLDVFADRPGAGNPWVEVSIDDNGEAWIGGRVQAVIRGSVDW